MPWRRQLIWKQLVVQRECTSACWVSDFLKFYLMVSMDCEPTSASRLRCSSESWWNFLMSGRALKIAIAVSIVLTPPAASFARGGHGGHGGFAGFARAAGSAGTGNVPISGVPRGPANVGGMNNVAVDPSGIGNAFRMGPRPQPNMAVSTQPGGTRNPAAPPNPAAPRSMSLNQQALPMALDGGGRQPRADQVPSESHVMNPNDPINRENARLDRIMNGICRGC
jgi:hypothetical protein